MFVPKKCPSLRKCSLPHKKQQQLRIKQLAGIEQSALTMLLKLGKTQEQSLNTIPKMPSLPYQIPLQEAAQLDNLSQFYWQTNKFYQNYYYSQSTTKINYVPTHINYVCEHNNYPSAIPKINIVTPEMSEAKETRIKLIKLMIENQNKFVKKVGNPILKTQPIQKQVHKRKTAKEHEKKLALNVINGCTKHRRQKCVNIECSRLMGF